MRKDMRRKGLVVGIIILFVGVSVVPGISGNIRESISNSDGNDELPRDPYAEFFDENEEESPLQNRGNTLYVGGIGPGNYTSIQDAINDASSGDSIFVYNGTYYENIVVDKSVYLVGEDSSITIIDGNYTDNTVKITGDMVNIAGFTIRNGNYSGILIWGTIWTSSNNNVILDCIIYNSYYGILGEYSSHNNTISDCVIYDNSGIGIYLYNSQYNNITDCIVYNNSWEGIRSYGSLSTNNSIINCIIYDNGDGIHIYDQSSTNVIGCLIFNNDHGIKIWNFASNNKIYWCTIANNSYGMYISDSDGNEIFNNNFINNSVDAYDECSNIWDNGYPLGGNHWGNNTTPDDFHGVDQNESDFDLIVDYSYTVSGGGNQDRWPYVLPYGWLRPLFVPNILLVQFNQSASNTTINNTISGYGTKKLEYLELVDLYILAINVSNQSEFDTLYMFNNDTYVNFASLDMYTYSREAKPRHLTKPDDQCYPKQWHLNNYGVNPGVPTGLIDADIDAPQAWEHITDCRQDFNGDDFVIAIIDSGVDLNHPDIKNNLWVNPAENNGTAGSDDDGNGVVDDIHGAEFNVNVDYVDGKPMDVSYYRDGSPDDESGHGTHCAGIICAEGNNEIGVSGVCWRAQIMVLKDQHARVDVWYKDIVGIVPSRLNKASKKTPLEQIKDAESSKKTGKYTFDSFISAIDYILKHKQNGVNVKVVSFSAGISRDDIMRKNVIPRDIVAIVPSKLNAALAEKYIRDGGYKETFEHTIGKLNESGILFVCAAGNDGRNIDIPDAVGPYSNYPPKLNLPNMIVVGASDNQDKLNIFSDWGTTSVDIVAPGENIMSLAMHGRYVYRDYNMDNKVSSQERRLSDEIRAIYPAGSIVEDDDGDLWDALYDFVANEKHDGIDAIYDIGENIYRDKDASNNVSVGDERLTHIYIDGSLQYHSNSRVVANDSDIGTTLYSFSSNEKHTEYLPKNNQYDCVEEIYKENIVNDKVSAGDLRLTNVYLNNHEKYSQVRSGDNDVGDCLHSFASNEKYYDKKFNAQYDPGEDIYIDNDDSDTVSSGDQRLEGKYPGSIVRSNDEDVGRRLKDFEYEEKYSLVQHRSGTSMATPVVTGEVAHFWCQFPNLTHLEVKDWILKKVDPRQTLKNTVVSGINNDGRVRMISGFDYGDAPDPYHGVFGQYPTVLRKQNASHGASHEDMGEEWLGTDTSPEYDANVNTNPPYDVDNSSNLLPSRIPLDPHPPYEPSDTADLDAYDDGVSLPLVVYAGGVYPIVFEINTEDPFINDVDQGRYDEYRSPKRDEKKIYINAYFDWNDDGDWDDGGEHLVKCPAKQCTWWGGPNMVCCYGVNWPPPNKNVFRMTTFPVPGDTLGIIWVRVRLDYGENVGRAPWPRYDSTHPFLTVGENLSDTYSHAQFGEVEDYFIISMKKEKIIGEPKYDDGDILWVVSETPIELVDYPPDYGYLVNNYYRLWYDGDWDDWIEYVDGEPFYLEGEGVHQIEFYGSSIETRMIFSEDFEDGYRRWTAYDLDGSGYTWEWTDIVPWWADVTTEGHFMLLDDNSMEELPNTDSLVSSLISCEIFNNTMLSFDGQFRTNGYEKLCVNVSTDYGGNWTNVLILDQNESGPWVVDLTDIADGNVIMLNFTYSDANQWGYGVLITEVSLTGEVITYSPIYYNYHLVDETPPVISDVTLTTSDPLDTDIGWENISCTVIDDGVGVDEVLLLLTYPDTSTVEISMDKSGDTYYYNTTFSEAGYYTYYILAGDMLDNSATYTSEEFALPMNEDVDGGGKVHFMDLVAVSMKYNDVGPPGWCREDVDNGGKVHFMDLVAISLAYNEEW